MSQVDNSLTSSKNVSAKNNSEKLLTFKLGNDEYAVDIMIVKEIRGWSSTTRSVSYTHLDVYKRQ